MVGFSGYAIQIRGFAKALAGSSELYIQHFFSERLRSLASEPFEEKNVVLGARKPRFMSQFLCIQYPVMLNL